jgi:uncharacterized secreted repeat protein (TIGR03808 family)
MPLDRRTLLSTGLVSTGLATVGFSAAAGAGPRPQPPDAPLASSALAPIEGADQTAALQMAVDTAAQQGVPLVLAPGRFRVGALALRPNTRLIGAHGLTVLEFTGGDTFVTARGAAGVRIEALVLDGNLLGMDANQATGLVAFEDCDGLSLRDLDIRRGLLNGITLVRSSGRIADCTVRQMSQAGLMSLDARGLDIAHNAVLDCANNGLQIWRSSAGEDGSVLAQNRIERIAAKGGGSGQNGNGINVYRAGGVAVSGNRITDCAYSAIRGNTADNIQMVGNACREIGEVALYAEFGFQGALIASNLVDQAASGIAVTNFNEGGRLAVVQGNLIRNLRRREHEPVDKRGVGIGVEADAAVSGNVIEGAPTAGIIAGWGPYLRDVAITGNLIRDAGVGILVTSDAAAGACLVAQNMISGARDGAIRAMNHGVPYGPDLAASDGVTGRLALRGNLAV